MSRQLVKLPYRMDITLRQDADFTLVYTMKDADEELVNNTGYEIEMEIRATVGSAIIDRYSTGTGEITVGGANGRVTVFVPMGTIILYTPGTYRYDLRETNTLDKSRYLFAGMAYVNTMITRAIIEP